MVKLSTEATVGLLFEVAVGLLDHLHVQEPLIIWGLFLVGLALIADSIIRGEWAEKISDPKVRTRRRVVYGVVAFLCLSVFGWWIFARLYTQHAHETARSTPPALQQAPPIAEDKKEMLPAIQNPAPSKARPSKQAPKRPKVQALPVAPSQPSVNQDCGGGNCAVSVGQQGGVTAGQIVVGTKTWNMTKQQQQEMIDILKTAHGSIRMEWLMFDPDSFQFSGGILYTFVEAGWTRNDRPNSAGEMCYPSTDWDCHGLEVRLSDKSSDAAVTVLRALSILNVPVKVRALKDENPSDLVVIMVAKP